MKAHTILAALLLTTTAATAQQTSNPLDWAARETTTGPLVAGLYGNNFDGARVGWLFESGGTLNAVGAFTLDVLRIEPGREHATETHNETGTDVALGVLLSVHLSGRWFLSFGDGFTFRVDTPEGQTNAVPATAFGTYVEAGPEFRRTSWLHVGLDALGYVPLGFNARSTQGHEVGPGNSLPDGFTWSYGVTGHLAFRLW